MPETGNLRPTGADHAAGTGTQARDAVDMLRAHIAYPHDFQRAKKVTCSGIRDPQTGHFCQFVGTPDEHYEHQVDRMRALLSPEAATGTGATDD